VVDQLLSFVQQDGYLLLLLPVIGAMIGWFTNILAVKMLFHPRKPIGFWPIRIQGVFPKRQRALAKKLGQIVSMELFSIEDVMEKLVEKAHSKQISKLVADRIEYIITRKLPVVIPMVAMVLSQELVEKVKEAFMGDLEEMIEQVIFELGDEIKTDLDVEKIVEEKVANFSSDKLEEILFAIMRKEFRFIELIGALLGFLIGCIQLGLLVLSGSLII